MRKKLILVVFLLRYHGVKYVLFRIFYRLKSKMGIHKILFPTNKRRYFNYAGNFIGRIEFKPNITPKKSLTLDTYTRKTLNQNILFFSNQWISFKECDWLINPITKYKYSINKHWSEINELSKEQGDIKFVWEKSRFSYLLPIMRNDYHNSEDHSEFVFSEIESWIDSNPINMGPNWKCSQEISLRVFNWFFLLKYYGSSKSLTATRWRKIQNVIYWSLHHVYNNINFSRIAVRNNHAITETLFLALSEFLFPFIPETKKWSDKGRLWFEEEVDYQIYNDGSYIQHSMNYQRVVVQLLTLGISITEMYNKPFSKKVHEKAYKCLSFLYQFMQDENGYLPNYGANDGAWFFPLSDTDYRDFRPQLNSLHKLLTGKYLYTDSINKEEFAWICGLDINIENSFSAVVKEKGLIEFPIGGYYIFRDNNTFSFIRCAKYKDRPSHADNLHIDVWCNGENILLDSGSYKYNTENKIVKYFKGTESHNTVMLDNNDQMLKGPRFLWLNWAQALRVKTKETSDSFVFEGEVSCFKDIGKNIIHRRCMTKKKNKLEWVIIDEIINKPKIVLLKQLWHTNSDKIEFVSSSEDYVIEPKFQSLYYGSKAEVKQVTIQTEKDILETKIRIK